MKSASLFEIVAARCWNVLNEGKTFTPIFIVSVYLIAGGVAEPVSLILALLVLLPLFILFYIYDYPLRLRWFLLAPLFLFPIWFGRPDIRLLLWAFGLYAFFTVFFWGTLYYHLRIGTTWWNFTRIWKLFLINSDSTSGNALEQLAKSFLLLLVLDWNYESFASHSWTVQSIWSYVAFLAAASVYSWIVHKALFNWKPEEKGTFTKESEPDRIGHGIAKRVVVIVIDGCRKERFEEAEAPFLKHLMQTGVYYDRMETVYPARTVVCFSSMFTGTYPREHGIRSNMVWRLGVQVESVFDKLKQDGKKGILFGCAHLIDAFGDHVESFTAVQKNDVVDYRIMERAKQIMLENKPELMVIQMIAVDQTGHSRGVLYPEYMQKINESDALIRDYCEWMEANRLLDDTVLVVMADHGQGNGIGGHGHLDEGERFVPFVIHGAGIRQGVRIAERRSIASLAPTISRLLGISLPSHSREPVLKESFEGAGR